MMEHQSSQKWYGVYRAVVVDVDDPKKLDRVRVHVPEVLGNVPTDWAWPKYASPNWSWKPVATDRVWLEFEAGDIDRPLYSGTWYPQQDGTSSVPQEVLDDYFGSRVIKSPGGHKILFQEADPDDSSAHAGITVETPGGYKIDLDESDTDALTVETSGGHKITLDDANSELKVEHSDGSTLIEIDSSGIIKITANPTTGKVELSGIGVLPLAGVVTKQHICAFTGAPHPQGSLDVEATG